MQGRSFEIDGQWIVDEIWSFFQSLAYLRQILFFNIPEEVLIGSIGMSYTFDGPHKFKPIFYFLNYKQ